MKLALYPINDSQLLSIFLIIFTVLKMNNNILVIFESKDYNTTCTVEPVYNGHPWDLHCTVEPVYNCHPWDLQKWLLYRGDLIIQSGFYVIG